MELVSKKELELSMLQNLLKKELPTAEYKVALVKEYTQKSLRISRACMLLEMSRSIFYPKKNPIRNDDDVNSKVGRPIPGFPYGINNCIVDDSVIETLLHEACGKTPLMAIDLLMNI